MLQTDALLPIFPISDLQTDTGRIKAMHTVKAFGLHRKDPRTLPAVGGASTASTTATVGSKGEYRVSRGVRVSPLVPLNEGGRRLVANGRSRPTAEPGEFTLEPTPLFVVHDVSGSISQARTLCAGLPMPCLGLQTTDEFVAAGTISDKVRQYVDAMRAIQSQGPYRLAAYSLGVLIAFHMTKLLEEELHETVEYVIALDHGVESPHDALTKAVEADIPARAIALLPLMPFLDPVQINGGDQELRARIAAFGRDFAELAQSPAGRANVRALLDRRMTMAHDQLPPRCFAERTRSFFFERRSTESDEVLRAALGMGVCLCGSFFENHRDVLGVSGMLNATAVLCRVGDSEHRDMKVSLFSSLLALAGGSESFGGELQAAIPHDYGLSRHFRRCAEPKIVSGGHFEILSPPHVQGLARHLVNTVLDESGALRDQLSVTLSAVSVSPRVRSESISKRRSFSGVKVSEV